MTASDVPSPFPSASGAEPEEITPSFRVRYRVLAWTICLIPLVLFVVFSAYQHSKTAQHGKVAVERTIQILEEHALRVFEAQQLILDQTDQYLADMNWSDIRASAEVHQFLRETAANSPHVDGLWLVPPDGRTANSADFFPFPDVNVSDRTYFRTLQTIDELHYGEMIVGRTKGTFNFNLSRRRSPRDEFNGVLLVTSSLDYFTDFWKRASEGSFVVGLYREDGEILARYPLIDSLPSRLADDAPLIALMQTADDQVYQSISSLDGTPRIYGFSRVGNTPLFIRYGVPNADVFANWRSETLRMGLLSLLASALLSIAMGTILRQQRHLGATAVSWRRTAEKLAKEVNRRELAEDVAAERMRLLDEVRTLTAQRQSILENMAEGVIALDIEGRIIYANREAVEDLGPFQQGTQPFSQLIMSRRIVAADGSDIDPEQSPEKAPLQGKDLQETEFVIRDEQGRLASCLFRGGAIFGADGQAEGAVLTFWDITERKREAERQDLLTRELDHRVRNMLATIMAMIRISNEPHQSKERFVAALSGRIGAMARTHGVLSEGRWEGVNIGRLVADEVANTADARQLVTKGNPELMLPPKEAADLALGLHELATNATKYGAWSDPNGCVTLTWWCEAGADGEVLHVRWKEAGGPAIETQPDRKGFGTTLLQSIFSASGGVSLTYQPDGVLCTFALPIDTRRQDEIDRDPVPSDILPLEDASLEGVRVLVVEDEPIVRLDLVEILRDAGAIIVAEAGSLEDGLRKAEADIFDAAVLDQNLNGQSSQPLARLLTEKGAAVVFVSGYRPPGSRDGTGGEDDGFAHLQKPISPPDLVFALARSVALIRSKG